MNIKTITCHDVYNFGATLQAYALMKHLELEGHNVEIINYKPDYLSKRYNVWGISPKWEEKGAIISLFYFAIKVPYRYFFYSRKGKHRFDSFKKRFMKIGRRRYRSNDELKINPPVADVYIAGSDQIWNTFYNNGRDPAFYLDFAPKGKRKVSYAASFSIDNILPEYKSFVKKMIEGLDFISVREREALQILKSIGINNGIHVLDPVFLLEKELWDKLLKNNIKGDYILVYDFENNPIIEKFVKGIAEKEGLKIYAANNYKKTPYADRDFFDCGPDTFITLIKNAQYIVSNSFHGTAFALIFEKEFFVFNRIRDKVNSRMRDLLKTCQLNNRLIENEADNIDHTQKIDYEQVTQILKKYISESKNYLARALAS